MYELIDINPKLIDSFYKALEKAYQKENWHIIFLLSVKNALHALAPQIPVHILEPYIKRGLEPLIYKKENNITTRNFIDDEEAKETYHNTFDNLIEELEKDKDEISLNLVDYFYDLLLYDQVTIVNNEKYLTSFLHLLFWEEKHLKAYETLKDTYQNKPAEMNISTSTSSMKALKDKVSFLKPLLKLPIANPSVDSKKEEIQLGLLGIYGKERRMMSRAIHILAEVKKENAENFLVQTLAELEPYIDSDNTIITKDIYISWYAHAIGIYKRLSKNKIPTEKALELARLYSHVIFPHLKNIKDDICSIQTARKPIRECAFYKGLRLLDFSDNRNKIKRPQEEIEETEFYLKELIKQLHRLS